MKFFVVAIGGTLATVLLFSAGAFNPAHAADSANELQTTAKALFGIIPADETASDGLTLDKIELGRKLFFDYRLSKDGSTACVRCHQPQYYSTDRMAQSKGFNGNTGDRSAQSILNLKYQSVFHWRNDRVDIEEQALRAFTTPLSLGNATTAEAIKRLGLAGYKPLFAKVFPKQKNAMTLENAASALSVFQRSLTTRSAFDKYLEGDLSAISEQAKKGLSEFVTVGCVGCHNGTAVGGQVLQKFGLFQNYWEVTKSPVHDPGRQAVTKKPEDANIFKVASLRNITETAPYFHDGSAKDLETAIRWMAKLQLNKELDKKQIGLIKAFLETLKGDLPKNFREAPELSSEPHAGQNI